MQKAKKNKTKKMPLRLQLLIQKIKKGKKRKNTKTKEKGKKCNNSKNTKRAKHATRAKEYIKKSLARQLVLRTY